MDGRRNVILLTIDCLRADHLSCLGYSQEETPNIDNLAQKGVLFSQAMSNGGNTMSSFPAILTSSYPRVHFSAAETGLPYRWLFLSETRESIAETLKKNGYQTAAFHSNPWISSFFHYDKGFDTFYDKLDKPFVRSELFRDFDAVHRVLDNFRLGYALYGIMRGCKGNTDRADEINKKAISWLQNTAGNFFLWLHYMDVHGPYLPLKSTIWERINSLRLSRKSRFPQNFSAHDLRTLINLYDREIRYVDYEIGVLLDKMSKIGISLDNTYIILTSDHGVQFMEHGVVGHGYLYDEVIHVPLVIAGPGFPNGLAVQQQVCLLDLSPTILDLLEIPKVETFQGTSFSTIMKGRMAKRNGVISEGNPFLHLGRTASRFSYRTEKWKYILLLDEKYRQIDAELYDMQKDSKEQMNIIQDEKEIAKELESRLFDHIAMENRERVKASDIKERSEIEFDKEAKREIERRLRNLGYM